MASAPARGAGGRRFESCHRDHLGVAQLGQSAGVGSRRPVVRIHPLRPAAARTAAQAAVTGAVECRPSTADAASSILAGRFMHARRAGVLEGSSNGRTADFGSTYAGSSPAPSAERLRPVGPEPDIPSMSSPALTARPRMELQRVGWCRLPLVTGRPRGSSPLSRLHVPG